MTRCVGPVVCGVCSGLTKVGVTWCGNWWCHPFFTSKTDHLQHYSHPLCLSRWSFVQYSCNSAAEIFYIFIRVSPPIGIARGRTGCACTPGRRKILDAKFTGESCKCTPGRECTPRGRARVQFLRKFGRFGRW